MVLMRLDQRGLFKSFWTVLWMGLKIVSSAYVFQIFQQGHPSSDMVFGVILTSPT